MGGMGNMDDRNKSSKIPFAGLGLVFGTAIGAGIAIAASLPIFWAGAGTGIGLVIGAAVDTMKKSNN